MSDFQVIVIGSGAGGLSSALFLAKQGFTVLLLEAMSSFGGYLNPFKRGPYTFDTGMHYLGELGKGQLFSDFLETLGVSQKLDFIELNPTGFDRYIFPDYEISLCKGHEEYKEKLIKDFYTEKQGIIKLFNVLNKVKKATKFSMPTDKAPPNMISLLLRNPVMLMYGRATYQKFLDGITRDKLLQAVLAAHSATIGLAPANASALLALTVLNHYLDGAYYPRGGSGAFRSALVAAIEEYGGKIKNLSKVVRIDKKTDEFVVKVESGEKYTSKTVISDADPVHTLGHLVNPEIISSKIQKKVNKLRPSLGAFYAFIGTDLNLPALGITDANIHHYDNIDINKMYDAGNTLSRKDNIHTFLLTSPSIKDPDGDHAPSNHHTLEIIAMADYNSFGKWADSLSMKRGEDYKVLKDEIGNSMIKKAEKYIPNLSKHLDKVEFATPLSNAYWVNALRGGCYGPEQTPDQMGPGRFTNFSSGIRGLFLVGAGTIGGGIMPCIGSGVLAGRKVVKHLN